MGSAIEIFAGIVIHSLIWGDLPVAFKKIIKQIQACGIISRVGRPSEQYMEGMQNKKRSNKALKRAQLCTCLEKNGGSKLYETAVSMMR